MTAAEYRARWVFAVGILVIVALCVVTAVLVPVKATDAGDGLGLIIGLIFWPVLAVWCIGGILVLGRLRRRQR